MASETAATTYHGECLNLLAHRRNRLRLRDTIPIHRSAQSPPDPNFVRQQIFPSYQAFKDELNADRGHGRRARARRRASTRFGTTCVPPARFPTPRATTIRSSIEEPHRTSHSRATTTIGSPAPAPAVRLTGTDLWYREGTLPDDARVDYKIVLNGGNWIDDPVNPLKMWSGFGPNSELRMPDYSYPLETIRSPNAARGTHHRNTRVSSTNLGYQLAIPRLHSRRLQRPISSPICPSSTSPMATSTWPTTWAASPPCSIT